MPPNTFSKNSLAGIANTLSARNKEAARALPDSKGGETPKHLQNDRTEVFTYFTRPGPTQLFYSAENWVRLKMTLETAGPVAVGQRADLTPVTSGKGRLLDIADEFEVILAKGTRFYIASGSVNRVSVTIEPIPWLEQISGEVNRVASSIAAAAQTIVTGLGGLLKAGKAMAPPPTSSSGKTPQDLPCPPPARGLIPRLTGVVPRTKMRR